MEWLMIDATHIKVHLHGTGAVGGNDKMGLTKGGSTARHLAIDAHGMPLRAILTSGTVPDCTVALDLLKELIVDDLLADRGYDSDSIIKQAEEQGIQPVVPPRKHRKHYRKFDSALYKNRHIIENVFAKIQQWRGIATRFAKRASSFLASIQLGDLLRSGLKSCDDSPSLIAGEYNFIATLANTSALLFERLDNINWLGFYLKSYDTLVLSPFQGRSHVYVLRKEKVFVGLFLWKIEYSILLMSILLLGTLLAIVSVVQR